MSDSATKGRWTHHGGGISSWSARDGEITYYGKFTDPQGVRRKRRLKPAPSLKQARQRLSEIRDSVRAGSYVDPYEERERQAQERTQRVLFEDLAGRFIQEYKPRSGDLAYYEEQRKVWLQFFEGCVVREITHADVREMLRKRLEKVGPSTARKNVIALGTLFRWAIQEEIIEQNPADSVHVRRPSDPASDSRAMTDDEYKRLFAASPNWLAALVRWACSTGMDKGMCERLRWPDLNLERDGTRVVSGGFKLIRGKTGKAIRQVLNEDAVAALNEARRASHTSGVVFLDDSSQPVEEKALDWALGKALKAAGVVGANFRTFRHTFATRALRAGIHPRVVAQMMGHSTAFITERYMHVADDMLEQAAQAMSGIRQARRRRVVGSGGASEEVGKQAGKRQDLSPDGTTASEPQPTLVQPVRRGAGVAEQGSLLSCYTGNTVSRVRIPPSPPFSSDSAGERSAGSSDEPGDTGFCD